MPQRDLPRRILLFDRLPALWLLLAGTLFLVIGLSLLGAGPVSWVYGKWAPARDFRGATLEDIVADFEVTGILPKGSTWASPELKGRRVTVRYSFYHQPSAVIEIVASKASIVVAGPANFGCSLCGVHLLGPVHIRAAAAGEPSVQWLQASREGAAKQHFEFERGTQCDLKDEPRFCVDARDEERANVAKILVGVLRKEPGRTVNTKCALPFHGIVVRYEGHFSALTHSRQRGPRYGFGEVRRAQAGKGDVALAYWMSDEPGTAAEVAGRFGRDLERLLAQVKSVSCRR